MTPEKDCKPVDNKPINGEPVDNKPVNGEPVITRFPNCFMTRDGHGVSFLSLDFEKKKNPLPQNGKVEKSA